MCFYACGGGKGERGRTSECFMDILIFYVVPLSLLFEQRSCFSELRKSTATFSVFSCFWFANLISLTKLIKRDSGFVKHPAPFMVFFCVRLFSQT